MMPTKTIGSLGHNTDCLKLFPDNEYHCMCVYVCACVLTCVCVCLSCVHQYIFWITKDFTNIFTMKCISFKTQKNKMPQLLIFQDSKTNHK
jgi:hypothetical protein